MQRHFPVVTRLGRRGVETDVVEALLDSETARRELGDLVHRAAA